MSTDCSTFKLNSAKDLNVSNFFEETEFSKWNFENYYDFVEESDSKLSFLAIRRSFLNDLEKLKKNDQLPKKIKSSLGNMQKFSTKKPEKKEKTMVIKGNTGIIIAGNKDCQINNTKFNVSRQLQPNDQSSIQQSDQSKKKRKILIDDNDCWAINDDDDFWSSWQEYFDECECHKYCLEKYHVIECGYTIQCKPSYNVDLYEQLGSNKHQVVKSPFMDFCTYTTKFMQELKSRNERRIMKALLDDDHWEEIERGDNSANARYVYDFFFLINKYIPNCSIIEKSESMFSFHLVWPILSLAVKAASSSNRNLLFKTGEVILDSSDETFKADGVIEFGDTEVCLLETSGAYATSDNSRFGIDHVKGSFGTLMFLRKILRAYFYATEETLRELKVIFVHARGKRIHLWSLEMPAKDVQILEHVTYTDIPTDIDQVDKILSLGNFVWKLNDCLRQSCQIISKMKEEHACYMTMRQLDPSVQPRTNLATFVEKDIQKPVKGSDYGIILPKQIDDCNLSNTIVPTSQR